MLLAPGYGVVRPSTTAHSTRLNSSSFALSASPSSSPLTASPPASRPDSSRRVRLARRQRGVRLRIRAHRPDVAQRTAEVVELRQRVETENLLDRPQHVGGVREAVNDPDRLRRDHEHRRAVRVHVVGAVLRIVLEHEHDGALPEWDCATAPRSSGRARDRCPPCRPRRRRARRARPPCDRSAGARSRAPASRRVCANSASSAIQTSARRWSGMSRSKPGYAGFVCAARNGLSATIAGRQHVVGIARSGRPTNSP